MGKHPTFATEAEFEDKVARYLTECMTKQRLPNVAGACAFMDIGRTTFYDYCVKYPNTQKRIEARIEDAWVNRLGEPGATGAIFYLKNAFRELYKDKHETDITSKGEAIQPLLVRILDEKDNGDTQGV